MDNTTIILLSIMVPSVAAIIGGFRILFNRIEKLAANELNCKVEVAYLRGEIVRITALLDSKDGSSEVLDAVIAIDSSNGMIVRWGMSAVFLLQLNQRQMLGKDVSSLIPKEHREKFQELWSKFLNEKRLPNRGPYDIVVLGRDNLLIPVSVTLTGWEENNKIMIEARLRRRTQDPDSFLGPLS